MTALNGAAKFQAAVFVTLSGLWALLFMHISSILLIACFFFVLNDFLHYEVTEATDWTTHKISAIIYVCITENNVLFGIL